MADSAALMGIVSLGGVGKTRGVESLETSLIYDFRRINSMESLREVIKIHEKVPMDDPQDRPDLYILAPMRLLSPIMEESALTTNKTCENALPISHV